LALAIHDVSMPAAAVEEFRGDATRQLLVLLEEGRGDQRLRSAYAVAVGLAKIEVASSTLAAIVEDHNADPDLRGHAGVALGQIGRPTPRARRALNLALSQRRSAALRSQAALGLALLGGKVAGTQLLRELDTGTTEQHLAQVVIALGRLGDLQAVPALVSHVSDDSRSELAQALGVVALGVLADPEPRPVLLRLTQHANYPTRTRALHEAYSIL
jgi:HEAT repeat protein